MIVFDKITLYILIKIVSLIFDFIGAIAAAKIARQLLGDKKFKEKIALLVYALYLFLPLVRINKGHKLVMLFFL